MFQMSTLDIQGETYAQIIQKMTAPLEVILWKSWKELYKMPQQQ